MSYFQQLPLELTEAILDYLRPGSLRATIRTAKFLRFPGEKRLYSRVILPINPAMEDLGDIQSLFLSTVANSDRLAQHVVRLVLGEIAPLEEGKANINCIIGQAMKMMINLKELDIFGFPYIGHAQLDSVPFSLTHLVMSGEKTNNEATTVPDLISILRTHPDLEELALDCTKPLPDLVAALKTEQQGLVPKTGILCPRLKRFDGYDDGLRLFLPLRNIESGTSLGSGAEYVANDGLADLWLTPVLKPSYQYLRVLEVWLDRQWLDTCFLPTVAPYLTSLRDLQLVDYTFGVPPQDYLQPLLGCIPALDSLTLSIMATGTTETIMTDAQNVVPLVRSVCPTVGEIYVGREGIADEVVYCRYTKRGGFHSGLVSQEVACRPYARWLIEEQ